MQLTYDQIRAEILEVLSSHECNDSDDNEIATLCTLAVMRADVEERLRIRHGK